jgi:predicted O-linked N-acetylglucosamine transferase (SPINDLY family)
LYKDLEEFYYLLENKKLKEAEEFISNCLLSKPDDYLLLNNYGTVLLLKNDFSNAITNFKKIIEIKPELYQAYYNIAYAYVRLFLFNEALIYIKKYFEYDLKNCDAYNILGIIFLEKNMLEEAIYNFNKCIDLEIDFVKAYNGLGLAFYKKKDFKKSIFFLENGIKFDRNFNILYFNLAKSYSENNQYINAIRNVKIFLDKEPNHLNGLLLLGACLINIGKILEGLQILKSSISLTSDVNFKKHIYNLMLFNSNYLEDFNFGEYYENISNLKNLFVNYSSKNFVFSKINSTSRTIKLGFVSADFKMHAVSMQILDVLRYLSNNSSFELYIYYNSEEEDSITDKFKSYIKNWRVVYNVNDHNLLEKIRSDEIDILIDLSGFSNGNRLEVFFNRAAPIQISWLGYLCSTGLKEIDYIFGDKNVITKKEETQFVEKIYKLNNTWTVLSHPDIEISVNKNLPYFRNKYITFGSFNNILKVNSKVIKTWSKILYTVSDSKLILIDQRFNDGDFKKYFVELFINYGVKNEQLIFEGDYSRSNLFEKYNSIDIALDTFPYNGGTTSLESFWMCVPVLTKKGNTFLSKCGESLNITLGLDEWVCNDETDYINKAIYMTKNVNKLQFVKDYLFKIQKESRLFDSKSLAENIGAAFKDMILIYKNNA